MYRCLNCRCEFDEPDEIYTSYEAYYGVASDFGSRTSLTLEVCPRCESDDIDEVDDVYEEEEEEE